jgi:hypothetical protein
MSSNTSDKVVICELLCFLSNKCSHVSFDRLVKIASEFYSWDAIAQAKGQLITDMREICPDAEKRFPKRKGGEKEKSTISDLLKCVLDPMSVLPKYVVLNLARIPPVGFEDVDAVSICNDLAAIKLQLKELMEWKSGFITSTVVSEIGASAMSPSSNVSGVTEALTTVSNASIVTQVKSGIDSEQTFAKVAASETRNAISSLPSKNRKPVKMNVGKANTSSLRVAIRRRSFDLYVSGLVPGESPDNVADVVKGKLPNTSLDISCEQLKTRGSHYSSFHVKIQGPEEAVKQASTILESTDAWDEGIVFRRFWVKRQ